MKRVMSSLALALSLCLLNPLAQAATVHYWYHFDNADNTMTDLIARFEKQNPDIRIAAENIPWNSYYDNLYTALVGGSAPDAAMVKTFALPRLQQMEVLEPLDDYINQWDGKNNLLENTVKIARGGMDKHYFLPVQYIVSYLYYRTDYFQKAGLTPPKTCDDFYADMKKLTQDTNGDGKTDIYGFGFRGGVGGQDMWAPLIMPYGGEFKAGGLTKPAVLQASQRIVDAWKARLFPPSATTDGFKDVIGAFKAGKTAMTIHHIGSANDLNAVLGDNVSAVPLPVCNGKRWAPIAVESNAIFTTAADKAATWKWIAFLSSAENNAQFNRATGQLPVTKSDTQAWHGHPKRFLDATVNSLPDAEDYPNTPQLSDFVNTVWPVNMQQALLGQISVEQMNSKIETLFSAQP
ncbi:ABC transporter substrate-binding protein [Pantoea sp. B65]|uniref:ABC transporter substrate-binding protein n=1 Tax=Pantoea sp. B65 TaxID=2813359 RepID=UPI0039B4C675